MKYELDGDRILVVLDRSEIIDISVGDTIGFKSLPDVSYQWTQQDLEFMENNPDDDLFLEVNVSNGKPGAARLILKP